MSRFKVKKVEFEPPIKGEVVKPFAGWVCLAYTDSGEWVCGCDVDSPEDAYMDADAQALLGDSLHPATVQMFRVEPA